MILERAQVDIKPGHEEAFAAGVEKAAAELFPQANGYRSTRLYRGIESPSRFLMVLEWDKVEDHEGFRERPELLDPWRELVLEHLAAAPEVEHFTPLFSV